MSFAFWNRLRWTLWPLAAGMLAAVLLDAALATPDMVWMVFAGIVAIALIATAFSLRAKPALDGAARAPGDSDLSVLPSMARDVFERLPDPLMLLDESGRVLFANRAIRGVIGIDAQRKHVSALVRTPALLDAIRRTAASGEPTSIELTFPVPVRRIYQAYVARAGSVTILLLHDLTAMKRAEQLRADFVANASHELRTPLAALSGFIDTLKGHAKDDMAAREQFLGIMTVEAERMRRLIDDLLSLTRIEQNEHVPPSGRASLEIVLREAVAALTPLASAEGIALQISAAPNLPDAVGERDELIQIFQNLIHNAIKYGRQGGHVWIALEAGAGPAGRGAEAMLVTTVRDDGEGIPPDAVPRLTERFYRVDVKRSREKGGTGLGLAIVKHIVNRHQGRLSIESRPGEGSTFTVSLPVAPTPGADAVTEMS
ncbi:MAG TPA: ATP-binding protein [Rhizomicrobium sp.]|nr:ATP-binding protein [Rhizomicrobium sp.]